MNLFVFVKRVPDTESKIKIDHEKRTIVEEGLNFVLSPYDEYAVEEALRLVLQKHRIIRAHCQAFFQNDFGCFRSNGKNDHPAPFRFP
ncbi:MAG: hypothetical protein KKD59_09240, partial [Acidobacteria bacterium]|nr:hypothetical protein [Acidobacteriota bacterium]